MSNTRSFEADTEKPGIYEIRLEGHLGSDWADWFEGAVIALEANGQTLITCAVVDQSALHGLLRKVRDLGLPLLSVNRISPGQVEA